MTAVHTNLIVGTETGDDAAVWRIGDESALVATADFITPIVDDARTWGHVAAVNAVSDVYAMGGRPLFALLDVGMVGEVTLTLLADAQTSGGLVFGVAPDRAAQVTGRLRSLGHDAAVIGYATHAHDVIRLR